MGCLQGRLWHEFIHNQNHEIEGVVFRTRVGLYLGQERIAIMASGLFLVIKSHKIDLLDIFMIRPKIALNPKGPTYGSYFSDVFNKLGTSLVVEKDVI